MLRFAAGLLVLAIVLRPAQAQVGFDRPGGDYSTFPARLGDPAFCAARCDHDPRCQAWSFSYPGALGPNATCRLKSHVPHATKSPCCVAGVKGANVALPQKPGVEFAIERPGGDYRVIDNPSGEAGAGCAADCQADSRCRAWTYLRPGYRGPSGRCFLKDRVTTPDNAPCCISGVVR